MIKKNHCNVVILILENNDCTNGLCIQQIEIVSIVVNVATVDVVNF